jgi:hypothetical protein
MDKRPRDEQFPSSAALLKFLRENVDDIESVVIPVTSAPLAIRDPQGRVRKVMKGAGAWIKLCGGESLLLSRDDAAMLINDGVLQRLKIKCVLDPLDRA